MSINNANYLRSSCEVIREINDLAQGDSETDKKIRKLCAEAEAKSKRLSLQLVKYEPDYHKEWWENTDGYSEKMIKRKSDNYKFHKL